MRTDPLAAPGPPLFVVGCGRSGTTLLRLMLDAHPEVAVPGESHFIPPLWRARRRYARGGRLDAEGLARDISRTAHFGHWRVPPEPFLERVRALERPSFAQVVEAAFLTNAEHHGKSRWADKTPIYVLHLPLLARLFPRARFVHLIRDGRDVAMSYLSVPWGPRSVREAAWKWRRDVSTGRRDGRRLGAGRYLELRYERLVEDPSTALHDVCRLAGLPFDDRMLEHHRRVDTERLAPSTGLPYHARSAAPATAGARDWRVEMAAGDVRAFEAIAGGVLETAGYERGSGRPGAAEIARAAATRAGFAAFARASALKKELAVAVGARPPDAPSPARGRD